MMKLIQCSTIGGPATCHWFKPEDIAGSRRLLPAFKANGTPTKARWPGEFEWHNVYVNRVNLIETGTPQLSNGWKARAESVRDKIIAEIIKV